MRKETKNILLLTKTNITFDIEFYRNTNSKFKLYIHKPKEPEYISKIFPPDIIVIIYDKDTINKWINFLEKNNSIYKDKRFIFVVGANQINDKEVKNQAKKVNAETFYQSLEKLYEKLAETETKEVIEAAEISEKAETKTEKVSETAETKTEKVSETAETKTEKVSETAEINEIVVKKNNIFKILFLILLTFVFIYFFIRKF
jgi:hypothetical protein